MGTVAFASCACTPKGLFPRFGIDLGMTAKSASCPVHVGNNTGVGVLKISFVVLHVVTSQFMMARQLWG